MSTTPTSIAGAQCRFCAEPLEATFVDLGMSPLCQTHIEPHQLNHMEPFYPLHVWVCHKCFLVQLEQYVAPADIFSDYAYFSSYSDSWVEHARRYTELVRQRFSLGARSKVMEIASNDGYLLRHFVRAGVPALGIEPAANVARVAIEKGVPTVVRFFGEQTAREIAAEHGRPNLLLGNNVLAHVPNINDFVKGMKVLLAPTGVVTMEFPHLQRLMEGNQFDTIYHEHFSYLSFVTVERIFRHHGLVLFDVEELPTHGGSLRIYARHAENESQPVSGAVSALRERERHLGYERLETYAGFQAQVHETKRALLELLIKLKRGGAKVVGYGAPGKGNTLLNYCGIRRDMLDFTADRSPYKYGRYTPGTHIPIVHPDEIRSARPDYILFLPWNLKDELAKGLDYSREWGCKFIVPIPAVTVF
ncbi:MAG TPA: class I SAM-dependent methyltransferase [Steroidobacteraceae bacterium]|nr:class I SAM-dependent methyltransferase [Steroidobacteraceae bacterium]